MSDFIFWIFLLAVSIACYHIAHFFSIEDAIGSKASSWIGLCLGIFLIVSSARRLIAG